MKDYIAPSIMCADLLNLESDIRKLELANADLIHYDIMDTTFTNQTMLPLMAVPMVKKITSIPLDIHVMIDRPERIIDTLLPVCKDAYVSFHVESTMEIGSLIHYVRDAGGKPGVAINSGTPISMLEEIIDRVDMVIVILGNGGFGPRQPLDQQLLRKVSQIKTMIEMSGRDILLSVDGGVSKETGKKTKEVGADTFVLGTSAIYIKDHDVVALCDEFRDYIK